MTRPALPLFRVQGADGRGPWKPGLLKYWVDENRERPHPDDVVTAFGLEWRQEIQRGWHAGCACRSFYELLEWFTPAERHRLASMGYKPVAMYANRIIRENADQVIFARKLPLNVAVVVVEWDNPDLQAPFRCLKPLEAA